MCGLKKTFVWFVLKKNKKLCTEIMIEVKLAPKVWLSGATCSDRLYFVMQSETLTLIKPKHKWSQVMHVNIRCILIAIVSPYHLGSDHPQLMLIAGVKQPIWIYSKALLHLDEISDDIFPFKLLWVSF